MSAELRIVDPFLAHRVSSLGDEASGIEDQVCIFQHPPAPDGDQFWIARSGSDNFDVSMSLFPFLLTIFSSRIADLLMAIA